MSSDDDFAGQKTYAFGSCLLDEQRRELRLKGQLQMLEPRVFDLLLHLLHHRDRVVTKSDLLDALWAGSKVTEGVISRAILKAREAIGDVARPGEMIRTVHRVGYRFVAEMLPVMPVIQPTHVTVPATGAAFRLIVLPMANDTGDETLSWVEVGLATLMVEALSNDDRLSVVSPVEASKARKALPRADTTERDVADELLRLFGAQYLLATRLQRAGGSLKLTWRVCGEIDRQGTMRGKEAIALGQRLAKSVENLLFSDRPVPIAFESADPLANHAFARAVEACEREEWDVGARLMQVVLDIEPRSVRARLQHLRAIVNLQDPTVSAVGESLIEAASESQDLRLLALAHEALGRALFIIGGQDNKPLAEHHLSEALRLAEPHYDEDWVVPIHLTLAVVAQFGHDLQLARRHYERARAARSSPLRDALIFTNLAALETNAGQPLIAWSWAQQALELGRSHSLPASVATSLCVLMRVEMELGLLGTAARRLRELNGIVAALPAHEAECVAWARVVAGELQTLSAGLYPMSATIAATRSVEASVAPRVRALLTMAQGHQALHTGNEAVAIRRMEDAAALMAATGYVQAEQEFIAFLLGALEGAAAGPALLERWCERVAKRSGLETELELHHALKHAWAALAHAAGDTPRALVLLESVASSAPLGRARAFASLDASWLHLEAGRTAQAAAWLREAGPWAREHPLGRRAAERCERQAANAADDVSRRSALRHLLSASR